MKRLVFCVSFLMMLVLDVAFVHASEARFLKNAKVPK